MKPPNKGQVGENIFHVLSFVERLSFLGGSKCIRAIGKTNFWGFDLCPLYIYREVDNGSAICVFRSTVHVYCICTCV